VKVLIAVVSCHTREEFAEAIRSTWLPSVPAELDIRFFRGTGATREAKSDETWLSCRDDYEGLPNKVQEIVRWAYVHDYDYVMKLDDDTILRPKAWLDGFLRVDFSGCLEPACKPNEIQTPWGFAYVLSRKAMELVLKEPLPSHGNDEAWVSTALYKNGIFLRPDLRYHLHKGERPAPAKRGLRAPRRDMPFVVEPRSDCFAYCCYLNWGGFHQTPDAVNLAEIQWLYERYCR